MVDIHPFRGVRYNQAIISDLAQVICPPYDVIPPHMQSELYESSEHNFIKLEHTRELPQDTASENKYTRAAATLTRWLTQGIFTSEERPTVYLHDHHFWYQGREYRRRGIITLVRLEEWESRAIRPHEGRLANPKSDRLNLLRALQADTSSIMALFEDRHKKIASALAAKEKDEPVIHFNTDSGEKHVLWAISETETLAQLRQHLAHQPLYIADEHHRYESALAYQRKQRGNLAYSYDRSDAANMVLNGQYQLAFLIGPVKADMIKMIADVGERMPGKSTYFYPKLPSGLVFYRMADR
jgi:uncharacterized protein (DUF1015 family)